LQRFRHQCNRFQGIRYVFGTVEVLANANDDGSGFWRMHDYRFLVTIKLTMIEATLNSAFV
jgi:hypothetical protein